ncbi:MAG: hypothetical protein EBU27_01070 [Opitutae bacterium]|nr:hypothetical protein [Opitutae bacterium]
MRIWDCVLGIKSIRRRLIFHLKQFFYPELEFEMPVGKGLTATLPYHDSFDSFSEIFLNGEYKEVLEGFDLPNKWLDFGCHMGFFSLWIERERRLAVKKCHSNAVLIDGDIRALSGITSLLQRNQLKEQWYFLHGAVADDREHVSFYQYEYMASNALKESEVTPVSVPVVKIIIIVHQFINLRCQNLVIY